MSLVDLPNGACVDPRAIVRLQVIANARPQIVGARQMRSALIIETRHGEMRVHCVDINGAEKLKSTLRALAANHGKAPRVANGIDYTGVPMPGDANYIADVR